MFILTPESLLLVLLSSGVFGGFLPRSAPSTNHTSVANSTNQISTGSGSNPLDHPVAVCQSGLRNNPCNSKTSVGSCADAATDVCNQIAAGKGAKTGRISSMSGTCRATVWTSHTSPSLTACTAAFQSIRNSCIAPGENSNPRLNLPNMRGWVNIDLTRCVWPVDARLPSYQMGSSSCDEDISGAIPCVLGFPGFGSPLL